MKESVYYSLRILYAVAKNMSSFFLSAAIARADGRGDSGQKGFKKLL